VVASNWNATTYNDIRQETKRIKLLHFVSLMFINFTLFVN
jgi:hypothetical protein